MEIAKKYAEKMWGVYINDKHPDSAITETVGEITEKDFLAGAQHIIEEIQLIRDDFPNDMEFGAEISKKLEQWKNLKQ